MKLAETKIVAAKAWENILNGRTASETLRAQQGKRLNERKNDLSGATAKLSTNKKKKFQYPLVLNTEPLSIFTHVLTSLNK